MTPGRRILDYLTSPQNLAGSGLGTAAAVTTLVSGAAGPLWPVVVLASYGIGAALGSLVPHREPIDLDDGLDDTELRSALGQLRQRKVPKELQEPVGAILDAVADLGPRWSTVAADPRVAHDVTATLTDYVPATLDAYAAIPAYLLDRHDPDLGQTPRQDAVAQLTLLRDRMRQVRDAAFADDVQRLQVQGAFLDQRFRRPAGGLDLPDAP